ncbi:MAG TPA: NAD-dependent epimerase/dehydratase family protein [Opitutaceae bacterium]|nr:NAD-dependent epimerase/dehydratase family protein [Opitutaceae bacterium]
MRTLLVTGAAGFIGRRMTVAAEAAGWRVIGLDRTEGERNAAKGEETDEAGSSGDWIVADITAEAPIELPAGIDAIIHLAGKAHALAEVAQDEAEYFRINTEGTRRMLEAAQRAGVRAFVLFSTVKAAGDTMNEAASSEEGVASKRSPKPEAGNRNRGSGNQESANQTRSDIGVHQSASVVSSPLDELCPFPPDTPYGQSKRAAEKIVLEGGYVPHPVVLRPCLVYGPAPKGNLDKMIDAVKRGRFPPLPEVGNKRSMVHIDDVIAAALLAAEHPAAKGQVFIAADNEPFSTRQLFEWICRAAGKRVPGWSVPLWLLRLLGCVGDRIGKLRGRRFVFDSDALAKLTGSAWYTSAKLQRELGWRPKHTLRATMPEIVAKCGEPKR